MVEFEAWVRGDVEENYELQGAIADKTANPFRLSEIKRIIERERSHHEFVKMPRFSEGENFKTVVGYELNFRAYLIRLERLAGRLLMSREQPVVRSVDKRGGVRLSLSSLGKTVLGLIREIDPDVMSFYRNHEFKPDLAVLLEEIMKTRLRIDWLDCGAHGFISQTAIAIEEFVHQVRKELRSEQVRTKLKNHRRMERQNFNSCWNYVRWLFGRRSRLLFVRVDFYFRPLSRSWGSSVEAHKCHNRFLRALRENRIVRNVMGYISKREIGIDRGTHFHILVAIDGHFHRDAAHLTRTMGERWEKICGIEERRGVPRASYFNCYSLKDFYKYNCIGLVRPGDWRMLKGLEIAIRYMCKETCHVRAGVFEVDATGDGVPKRLNIGKRNIIRGIRKVSAEKKRGAPRKAINQHGPEYQWGCSVPL